MVRKINGFTDEYVFDQVIQNELRFDSNFDNDRWIISENSVTDTLDFDRNLNTVLSLGATSSTFNGDLDVTGSFTATTLIGVTNMAIIDNIIELGISNTADTLNLGWHARYNDGADSYFGLLRDTNDSTIKLIDTTTKPTNTGALSDLGNLTLNNITGTIQTAAQPNITSLGTQVSGITLGISQPINFTDSSTGFRIFDDDSVDSIKIQRNGVPQTALTANSVGRVGVNGADAPTRHLAITDNDTGFDFSTSDLRQFVSGTEMLTLTPLRVGVKTSNPASIGLEDFIVNGSARTVGHLGIGGAATQVLDITASNLDFINLQASGSSNRLHLAIGDSDNSFQVGKAGANADFFTNTTDGDGFVRSDTTTLHLGVGSGASNMTIDSSRLISMGDRLIVSGDTVPAHFLHGDANTTNSTVYIGGGSTNQRKTAIITEPTGSFGRNHFHIAQNNAANLTDATTSDAVFTIEDNGGVKINKEDNYLSFDAAGLERFGFSKMNGDESHLVAGSGISLKFGHTDTTDISVATGITTDMTITNTGNVGIRTTSPNVDLQIDDPTTTSSFIQITNNSTGNTISDGALIGMAGTALNIQNQDTGDINFFNSSSTKILELNDNGEIRSENDSYHNSTGGANEIVAGDLPRLIMRRAANQTISTSTITTIDWDTNDTSRGGITESAGTITVASAGTYLVTYSVIFDTNSTGIRFAWVELSGGRRCGQDNKDATSAFQTYLNGTCVLNAAASDTFTIRVFQTSGGNLDVVSIANSITTELQVVRMGNN